MKKSIILSTLLAAVALAPLAQADLSTGYAPQGPAVQGNCDLLATNTVRAIFRGYQDVILPDENGAPMPTTVAVFEVIENLAHRRHSRYGDGAMMPGLVFSVEMSRQVPGQPAEIVDTIAQLQPGDETVMRMDHLFLYGEPNGVFLRPCARMARRTIPQPTETDAPVQPAPNGQSSINGSGVVVNHSFERRVVYDGRGAAVTQEIEVIQESIPGTNQVRTRVFINGVEVDPQTQQPIAPSTRPAKPAQPAQPATPVQPVQPAQPAPLQPADPQPATAPAPAPTPDDPNDDTILESESF